MRNGTQYTYRCPQTSCRGSVVYPHALPAAAAIDWTPPAQRIRDRRKPLQPRTLARIAHGLRRYGSAMLVPSGGTWNSTARPTTTPMRARTTHETEALLVPVEGRTGKQARTMCDPMRAQTARAQDALVVPPQPRCRPARPAPATWSPAWWRQLPIFLAGAGSCGPGGRLRRPGSQPR